MRESHGGRVLITPQFVLNLAAKLVIVLFAGSGGSCTGIEQAIGRHVDIAVNHNEDAVSCHAVNHPQTRHYRKDVRELCPRELTGGRPAGYFHASPDCTHFSQALGGQPRDTEIRSLSWVVVRWAGQVCPDVITLENVEQIRKWGPLIAKATRPPAASSSSTAAWPRGGSLSVVTPVLIQTGFGERAGQAPRALDIEQPLGTVVAGGAKHALATAFVEQANGFGNALPAHSLEGPLSTIMTKGANQRLVTAHLAHLRGNCDARPLDEPLRTVSAGGQHHGLVEYHLAPEAEEGALRCAAFLIRYYGEGGQWGDLREPMHTITTKDRLALVTVWIRGEPWVVVDICLRMLVSRELANATGFPRQYVIDRGHDGRMFTKTQQVAMIGNAVPPGLQRAVTVANYSDFWDQLQRRVA